MTYKSKIKILLKQLEKNGSKGEIRRLKILLASLEDKILDETDIDSDADLLKYLETSPGQYIYLDTPIGHKKSFGDNSEEMPFHYGEFSELINPADDMGWDIIIVPSQSKSGEEEFDYGNEFVPVGIVRVNPSIKEWASKTKSDKFPSGKKPPIGNDKLILARMPWDSGSYKNDVAIISNFFDKLWQFGKIDWYR